MCVTVHFNQKMLALNLRRCFYDVI